MDSCQKDIHSPLWHAGSNRVTMTLSIKHTCQGPRQKHKILPVQWGSCTRLRQQSRSPTCTKERGRATRSSLKGRERAIINQTDTEPFQRQRWGNFWEMGSGWSAPCMCFPECIATILNWTDNCSQQHNVFTSTRWCHTFKEMLTGQYNCQDFCLYVLCTTLQEAPWDLQAALAGNHHSAKAKQTSMEQMTKVTFTWRHPCFQFWDYPLPKKPLIEDHLLLKITFSLLSKIILQEEFWLHKKNKATKLTHLHTSIYMWAHTGTAISTHTHTCTQTATHLMFQKECLQRPPRPVVHGVG